MAGSNPSSTDVMAFISGIPSSASLHPFSPQQLGKSGCCDCSSPRSSPLRRAYARPRGPSSTGSSGPLPRKDPDNKPTALRDSFRSSSYLLPSPPSSDDEFSSVARNHENHGNSSFSLPTPPASDDEELDDRLDDSKQANSREGSPFPLRPSVLPIVGGTTLPRTPNRRATSVYQQQSPTSALRDRFMSNRHTPTTAQSPSETFRLSKAPQQLLPAERLLRDTSVTPDPFGHVHVPSAGTNQRNSPIVIRSPSRPIGATYASELSIDASGTQNRQVSAGAIWNVGGTAQANMAGPVRRISNGRGGFISSGSNAPMYESHFLDDLSTDQDVEHMERRLAAALEIDQAIKVLNISCPPQKPRVASTDPVKVNRRRLYLEPRHKWRDSAWTQDGLYAILDAPGLRDDYYCTVLAYCYTTHTLAVGLANRVYLWTEDLGVRYPPDDVISYNGTYVTSVSFSSKEGGHSILAIGRNSGQISLWSLYDYEDIRFKSQQPSAIACISFKPVTTRRPSERFGSMVPTEELLVGDDIGHVYYYSIEWMSQQQIDIHGWNGHMKLLAKIQVHSQQICGLAWSPNGEFFATGANDNACYLFEAKDILKDPRVCDESKSIYKRPLQTLFDSLSLPSFIPGGAGNPKNNSRTASDTPSLFSNSPFPPLASLMLQNTTITPGEDGSLLISEGRQRHKWIHSAAVKAIAFCPWQRGLIAAGGGSNDRAIHFYHTFSGACLATINVHAQVTSLIWSTTRREIAATFGYAQPEHPYRIAVFSWPECRKVVAIPWSSDMRALSAISYPFGPREADASTTMGETWYSRTAQEGCIVVASSDESVKFHEVWSGSSKNTGMRTGLLGGSTILEGLEGIERDGRDVIR
ncbi:MAG: hypothetical protein Q9217_000126 [Psora testacea]